LLEKVVGDESLIMPCYVNNFLSIDCGLHLVGGLSGVFEMIHSLFACGRSEIRRSIDYFWFQKLLKMIDENGILRLFIHT